jgi:hypothetical protein
VEIWSMAMDMVSPLVAECSCGKACVPTLEGYKHANVSNIPAVRNFFGESR